MKDTKLHRRVAIQIDRCSKIGDKFSDTASMKDWGGGGKYIY